MIAFATQEKSSTNNTNMNNIEYINKRVTGPNQNKVTITGTVIGIDNQVKPMTVRDTFLVVYEDGKSERNWIKLSEAKIC
jgi:hypothetical protein